MYFFCCLSSGYSCSICSYTRSSTQHTHTTHITRVQTNLQLHSDLKICVLLETTEIHRFRRRRARRNPIVASRTRGRRVDRSKRNLFGGHAPVRHQSCDPRIKLGRAALTPEKLATELRARSLLKQGLHSNKAMFLFTDCFCFPFFSTTAYP